MLFNYLGEKIILVHCLILNFCIHYFLYKTPSHTIFISDFFTIVCYFSQAFLIFFQFACIYHLRGAIGGHSPLLVLGILYGSLSDTTLFRADYWTDFKFNCVNFFCVDVSCSGVFVFFSTFLSWTFSVLLDIVNTTHGSTLRKVNLS